MKFNFKDLTHGKGLVKLQSIVLLVLIIAMLFMSFGTIFTIEVDGMSKSDKKELSNFLEEELDLDVKLPDKVDVNAFTLIKIAGSVKKLIESLDNSKNVKLTKADEEELLKVAVILYVCAGPILSEDGLDNIDGDNAIATIINLAIELLIPFFCFIYLMILAIIIAISLLIASIRAILGFFNAELDNGEVVANMSKSIHRIIKLFPAILLIRLFCTDYKYGSAIIGILVLSVLALVLGVVVSRLKKYEPADFKYLNVLQIISAVSVIGLALFVFSILKTDIFMVGLRSVFDTYFFEYMIDGGEFPVVPFILLLVLFATVSSAVKAIPRILTRVACMSKTKSAVHIPSAVIAFIAVIIPSVMKGNEFIAEDVKFELTNAAQSSMSLAIVGLVIMLVAEIALKVVPNYVCEDCTKENRQKIVTGAYYIEIEDAPAAEEVAAEAPAAEEAAPAEEAPAAEEAAPAEEAPAAEEKVEETTAE